MGARVGRRFVTHLQLVAAQRNPRPRVVRGTTVSVDPACLKLGVPSANATMSKRTLAKITPRKNRSIHLKRITLDSFLARIRICPSPAERMMPVL